MDHRPAPRDVTAAAPVPGGPVPVADRLGDLAACIAHLDRSGALARVRPDLPAEFVACISKALRKDPRERYQTMGDLAADLRHFKRATDSGLVPPARPRGERRIVLAAVVLSALGALGWLGWRLVHTAETSAPMPPFSAR